MRTTVTLDQDVERMLREAVHRSRSSFKQTLNAAIRAGLGQQSVRVATRPFIPDLNLLHCAYASSSPFHVNAANVEAGAVS